MDTIAYRNREVLSLTGLRGVAACYVMLYHFEWSWGLQHPAGLLATFLNHGYLSVDLFFMLSGFVMSMVYIGHDAGPGFRLDYTGFLSHRLARIYPLYACVTLGIALMLLARIGHSRIDTGTFLGNLVFLQGFGAVENLNGPSWSVALEWISYFLFPLLIALVFRPWTGSALTVAVLAFCLILAVLTARLRGQFASPNARGLLDVTNLTVALTRCLAGFVIGMAAWAVRRAMTHPSKSATIICESLAATCLLLSLFFSFSDAIVYLAVPVLLVCLSFDLGPVARMLASPPVHQLGVLSYAIYLMHFRAQFFWDRAFGMLRVGEFAHHLVADAVTACLVVLLASLAHRAIEKPGRRFVRRVLDRRHVRAWAQGSAGRNI